MGPSLSLPHQAILLSTGCFLRGSYFHHSCYMQSPNSLLPQAFSCSWGSKLLLHIIINGSAPLIRFPNRGLARQIVKVRPAYSRGLCQMRNSIRKHCIWSFLMVPSGKKIKMKPTTNRPLPPTPHHYHSSFLTAKFLIWLHRIH